MNKYNSLGRKCPLGLDVKQSPDVHVEDNVWPRQLQAVLIK